MPVPLRPAAIRNISQTDWFGPLEPMRPTAPFGTQPRQFEFDPGQNLIWQPRADEPISFQDLIYMADNCDLVRVVIEALKDQICLRPWQIRVASMPGETQKQRAIRTRQDPRVEKWTNFFSWPNPDQCWTDFLRMVLEDLFVLDAPCYAPDVEVLTRRGWLRFEDTYEDDEFASRSESGTFEWQKPTSFIKKKHRGELVHFTGRTTDILVTPNHNMLAAPATSSLYKATTPACTWTPEKGHGNPGKPRDIRYSFVPADELEANLGNRVYPATSSWLAEDLPTFHLEIPRNYPQNRFDQFEFDCSGDDFFAFMGMWLAEGSVCECEVRPKNQRSAYLARSIDISQLESSKGFNLFGALLKRIRGVHFRYNKKTFSFQNRALFDYLKQFGHAVEKFIPDIIKDGSERQIRIFLEYFTLGDGHYRKHKPKTLENAAFTTGSRRLADDLQELCQKAGLSASIRPHDSKGGKIRGRAINASKGFRVYVRASERVLYRKAERIPYSGPVYCVDVPNHTLYVRRNGYPMWCGNCILLQRTRGGKIGALRVIDGQTITRLIDENGFTPEPPDPAYQQILYGQPAVELTTDDLIYRPRNQRARKMYGMSPVEQVMLTLNIALRKMRFSLNYYTEGNVPEALYTMPASVTSDRIAEFQGWFDLQMAGNLANRRRIWFIPGDDKGVNRLHFTKEAILKDEADEWFARIICFAFRVSPKELVKAMNRATSVESQDSAEEMGVHVMCNWVTETVNFIIQRKGGDPDIEFTFNQKREADVLKQAQADKIYIDSGIRNRNEVRDDLGENPSEDPDADILGITTQMGFIPLALAQQQEDNRQQEALAQQSAAANPEPKPAAAAASKLLKAAVISGLVDTNRSLDLETTVADFLQSAGEIAVKHVEAYLNKAAGDPAINKLLDAIDNDTPWDDLVTPVAHSLFFAAGVGVTTGVGQLQISNVGLISSASESAQRYSNQRAAELVGRRWQNGKLVENPKAVWRIDKTTRFELRDLIQKAFSEDTPLTKLTQQIREAGAFSAARAKMIAVTEITKAQSMGQLGVWKSMGTVKTVRWIAGGPDPCEECLLNQASGPVEIGKAFPSGDVTPGAHPLCRCSLTPAELN